MRLDFSFFDGKSTIDVARDLIGKVFVFESDRGVVKGIINETEAYTEEDESCHAFGGNRTKRNEVMFWRSGHLYVYFTYGMYFCCNVVSGDERKGEAVLIRGVVPLEGLDLMIENRNWNGKPLKGLVDGPAKFAIAFGLGKEHNGEDLLLEDSKIYIEDLGYVPKKIERTTRIGITKATHLEWRFVGRGL